MIKHLFASSLRRQQKLDSCPSVCKIGLRFVLGCVFFRRKAPTKNCQWSIANCQLGVVQVKLTLLKLEPEINHRGPETQRKNN